MTVEALPDLRDRQVERETLVDLVREEAFRAAPYRDSEGNLTVGYGTKFPLSRAEADWLLRHRYYLAVSELSAEMARRQLPRFHSLPVPVRRALGQMAYQMGVQGLLGFERMFRAIKAGNWRVAALEALDSAWARETPKRAERVAALIKSGGGR